MNAAGEPSERGGATRRSDRARVQDMAERYGCAYAGVLRWQHPSMRRLWATKRMLTSARVLLALILLWSLMSVITMALVIMAGLGGPMSDHQTWLLVPIISSGALITLAALHCTIGSSLADRIDQRLINLWRTDPGTFAYSWSDK
jgi:hypothetical protein